MLLKPIKNKFIFYILLFNLIVSINVARENIPVTLKNVDVTENLGASVKLDLNFKNTEDNNILFSNLISNEKVTILNFAYYTCPMLCHFVLNGMVKSLNILNSENQNIKDKYQLITISIDPDDTKESASNFKNRYVSQLNRKINWEFLFGNQNNINEITKKIGFNYFYNTKNNEFSHSAVIFIISPKGKISRYLYGFEFDKEDLKLSIIEARLEKSRSVVERLLLFCYNYDPIKKKYVIYAVNLMKISGIITILSLLILFLYLKRKYR
ncbi:hypothetical protein DID75_04100 [Candidatus Marinamargulisbacteria bacterium SCGC AG-410-N11]|nr:hypothetical protein DID75_04100 [Candidatus Marinamargulisbacteria bacterium SCGC AG-410-N11]